MAWGDAYEAPNGAPAVFQHACGHPAGHDIVLRACGVEVTPHNAQRSPAPA